MIVFNRLTQFPFTRYIYCEKCFKGFRGDTIHLGDEVEKNRVVKKTDFQKLKNDHPDPEP